MPIKNNVCADALHVLQLSDALDLEFASALAELVPTTLWEPHRRLTPLQLGFREIERRPSSSSLRIRSFPVLRGFARFPLSALARTGPALVRRLLHQAADPTRVALICTTPFFAPVAELWPGPVVYWLTDLIARYEGAGFARVRRLDERLCRAATLVCPNSERIAAYLHEQALCPADRLLVLPNATGARSLLPAPLLQPTPLPDPFAHLPRPLAGVIGNLAENTDWLFLDRLLQLAPAFHWLFVGPAHEHIHDRVQRRARRRVLAHPRTCFTGPQPYTELFRFARALDVAVLPYRLREPTFSGSSTRFYDHLAACHPILATGAVHELRAKEPLLTLVPTPEVAAAALSRLCATGFQDGIREARWESSQTGTWHQRAQTMLEALRHASELKPRLLAGTNRSATA